MHHIGKVVYIFSPKDKNILSSDKSYQATLKMWDENLITVDVAENVAEKLVLHDIVLVDYNPIPGTGAPRMVIIKILKGKAAKEAMKIYEDHLENRKKPPVQNGIPLPFPRQQIT